MKCMKSRTLVWNDEVVDRHANEGTNSSTAASTSEDSYLINIRAYRDQIEQISKLINKSHQWELASNYDKVKNVETQIVDAIDNLESLKGKPSDEEFKKGDILKHLYKARVELNQAARLASSTDVQVQNLCFDHLVECRNYLNLAKDLMSPF